MEKLVRLGLKKMQGLYLAYKQHQNDEIIPEIPPMNDIVIKLLLRSPNGVRLRVSLIQVLYHEDPDRYYFRQGLRQMIKYTK